MTYQCQVSPVSLSPTASKRYAATSQDVFGAASPDNRQNSISFVILDKDSSPRYRPWGVTISWSHPDLAALLPPELFARLKDVQPDPTLDSKERGCEGVMLRDGATGEPMVEPYFPGIRRVNLQKWRKVMGEGIDVKFGKALTNITNDGEGVTAHFSDGTTEKGSVLIGADGGGSAVRRMLLPSPASDPEILPYEFLNFPVKYTAEQALYFDKAMHPIVDVGVHPKSMYIGLFILDKVEPEQTRDLGFLYPRHMAKGRGCHVRQRRRHVRGGCESAWMAGQTRTRAQ